jgi:hypothetical protein
MCSFHRSGFLRTYALERSFACPMENLPSLAGNIDSHHQVAIADLIVAQSRVVPTVERLMQTVQPDVVGLSLMATALTRSPLLCAGCARPPGLWPADTIPTPGARSLRVLF